MRGRQNHTTALQQHTATYSTVLLFSVTTQIRILNKLYCTVWRNCPSTEDPKQHLFSCQFVMFCIKLCCRAPPPSVYMSVHLKAAPGSRLLPRIWMKYGQQQQNFPQTSTHLTGWRYKELALFLESKRLLQLQAVWVWNCDKIRSRQRQRKAGNICELERCCSLSASRVSLM